MSAPSPKRVLITGVAGLVGGILHEGLRGEYELSGLDRRRAPGVDHVADVKKLRRIRRAFTGKDAVIDLAANPSVSATWKEVYENNVLATINTLEAAREAGVSRVVFASSNHVTGLYERDHPYSAIVAGRYEGLDPSALRRIRSDDPIRPDSPYGVSKVLGEAAGRYYAEEFELSVICLRIGTVNAAGRPQQDRDFATLLTHRDLVHLVDCCLKGPEDVRFGVFYGVSANTWRFWEIEDAEAALGYRPRDDAEAWRQRA